MAPAGLPEKIVENLDGPSMRAPKPRGFIKTQEKMNALPFWRTSKQFTEDIQGALKTSGELLRIWICSRRSRGRALADEKI